MKNKFISVIVAVFSFIFGTTALQANACMPDKPQTEEIQPNTPEETSAPTSAPQQVPSEQIMYYTEEDVVIAAKIIYRESRGIASDTEKACVVWTICNRVDAGLTGKTFHEVATYPGQFAYIEDTPVWDELYYIAKDVLSRWNREKNGELNVGRVLPREYMWYRGDGAHNYFRDAYNGNFHIWDYSLESPYAD